MKNVAKSTKTADNANSSAQNSAKNKDLFHFILNKIFNKKLVHHLIAIAVMYLITVIYFSPVTTGNKDLPQSDMISVNGMTKSVKDYQAQTGEYSGWTNSMFSGMPTETLYGQPAFNIFASISKVLHAGLPYTSAAIFFAYLLGFYIFLACVGANTWLSLLGAIAYAFASYNLIVIEAGHITKAYAMAYMAPMIGGVILAYRKKYLAGFIVALLFVGIEFAQNHLQIAYYLGIMVFFIILVYFVYYLIQKIKKQEKLATFFKASAFLLVAAVLGVLPSMGNMYSSYDYSKDTMRGGSELSITPDHKNITSSATPNEGGLEIDYAFAWSYGQVETLSLLLPNIYGGSSYEVLEKGDETLKELRSCGYGANSLPTYWGKQPFTSGPVYAGAIICFLFIFGLFVVKGPEKWWILILFIISIVLSWGRHFMPLNEFLFHNLPFYSKFRAPSMALVIAGVLMPMLGMFALKGVIDNKIDKKVALKYSVVSACIVCGISLFIAFFAKSLFSFTGSGDAGFIQQLSSAGFSPASVDGIMAILQDYRASMLVSDGYRTFAFAFLAFLALYFFIKGKLKKQWVFFSILGVLVLADMWTVDRRYLNDDDFQPASKVKNAILPTQADNYILQDNDPNFRVLNLSTNTFNEAQTSYFHKSIGGYSPAKLRRYQDMIDFYIQNDIQKVYTGIFQSQGDMSKIENPESFKILNMLNAKYIIVPANGNQPIPIQNPHCYGNAWFVQNTKIVANPDEEILALENTDLKTTAVVDKRYEDIVKGKTFVLDSMSSVKNTLCYPNKLQYDVSTNSEQLLVFSEVFYDKGGWEATLDGKPVSHFRVNYILRAMLVPAGKHQIEFNYIPHARITGCQIAGVSSWIVILMLISCFIVWARKSYKLKNDTNSEAGSDSAGMLKND